MMDLRIACLQFCPVFKDVAASQAHADGLLQPCVSCFKSHLAAPQYCSRIVSRLSAGQTDLLVLPEMAFTGYCFASPGDIEPWLEDEEGPTITWAKRTGPLLPWTVDASPDPMTSSLRLQCAVMVGFPERCKSGLAYNSLAIVDALGSLISVYRKHHLYETDESWATEGEAFVIVKLNIRGRTVRICPCICMDLNPLRFVDSPFEAYELATSAVDKADLVVCSMNWLVSKEEADVEHESDWEAVRSTISYFALRCTPLLGSNVAFVGCNRIGTEGETTFTGSSCLLQLSKRPICLEYASKDREQLLQAVVTIE